MSEMRSDEEIIRYYRKIQPFDFFGIWGTEFLMRLPLHRATAFMKPDHGWTEETWAKAQMKKDRESIVDEMEDYFQDAVEKVLRHTKFCLTALDHYRAWTWLLADMDIFAYITDDKNFPNFGAPMIAAVMQKYEFDYLLPDEEIRKSSFQNMANGKKCNEFCVNGCHNGRPNAFQKTLILPKMPIVPKVV